MTTQKILESLLNAKILIVGAGGIGCELLKYLALFGAKDTEIVDLDTIDVSNLNRQFLFQKNHVGGFKSIVAKESIEAYRPGARIVAHTGNIKDARFSVNFFESFDIVLNALDNLDARRHVNFMCYLADVPLIESGTAGYLGQVSVIKRGVTECFDCQPKPVPTTYPVCTIRSTPTTMIHCIVWAKDFLLNSLFGPIDTDAFSVKAGDSASEEERASLDKESREFQALRATALELGFGRRILAKVFVADVERLAGLVELWKDRSPPKTIMLPNGSIPSTRFLPEEKDAHRLWSQEELLAVFTKSAEKLALRHDKDGDICFDKDDEDVLDFVYTASVLRATVFGITPDTKFTVKAKAGNIIPAIASTNSVIAGLAVMNAVKMLSRKCSDDTKTTYYCPGSASQTFQPQASCAPNPACGICSKSIAKIACVTQTLTLGQLIHFIFPGSDVTLSHGARVLYDPDFEVNTDKTLDALAIKDGDVLMLSNDDTDENWYLIISNDPNATDPLIDVKHKVLIASKKRSAEEAFDVELPGEEQPLKKVKVSEAAVDDPPAELDSDLEIL